MTGTISSEVEIVNIADTAPEEDRDGVAASRIDLGDSLFSYEITDSRTASFQDVNDETGFNGIVVTYGALGAGSGLSLHAADIVGGTNTIGIAADKVRVEADALFVNLDGLGVAPGRGVDVQLGFRIVGGTGDDRLRGDDGRDRMEGGNGSDRLKGGAGDDDVRGDRGEDRVVGQAGDDRLAGGKSNDRLKGGDGDDRLDGGKGSDSLVGGLGADEFYFLKGADVVRDFENNVDVLLIDAALVGTGIDTAREVVRTYGEDRGDDVLLDFGRRGTLLIEDVDSLKALRDDLELV